MRKMAISILIVLISLSTIIIQPPVVSRPISTGDAGENIVITEDNITSSPYFKGGSGIKNDPWILEFGSLDLGGGSILLTNFTNKYVVIRYSKLHNGYSNILSISGGIVGSFFQVMGSSLHDISGTGYILYISVDNSTVLVKDSSVYNSSSSDWWDAVVCIENTYNSRIVFDNVSVYYGGHGIRITGTDDTTIEIIASRVYGIRDDAGWGTDWRGLIRIDGDNNGLNITAVDTVFAGSDSVSPPSAVEVESTVNYIGLINTEFKYSDQSIYRGIHIKSGSVSDIVLINITVDNGALSNDLVHIGSGASGAYNCIVISRANVYSARYILGISPDATIASLELTSIECRGVDGLLSSGGRLTVSKLLISDIRAYNITKLIQLYNDDNTIKDIVVERLNVTHYSDGLDIRGVVKGLFRDIAFIDNDRNGDGWADGNGLYFRNVNNTVLEDLYFEDAGWKNIILDGYHENITIKNFIDKENVHSNGQNMLIAIGPWGDATIKNITIENGIIQQEDLITMYDENDYVEDLEISNVTVYDSAPKDWESGRCGNAIYMLHARNVSIEHFTSIGAENNGIYLLDVDNAVIAFSNISKPVNYAIYIGEYSSNIYVYNNTFYYAGVKPQVYSDSRDIVAEYNLYSDLVSSDADGDGIADTPYTWDGAGGVVDLKPIYTGSYIALYMVTDDTVESIAVSGSGTAGDPYIVILNNSNVPQAYLYGCIVDNLTKHVIVKGIIGGSMGEAALYIGSNITEDTLLVEDLYITGSSKHGLYLYGVNGVKLRKINVKASSIGGWAISLHNVSNIMMTNVRIDLNESGWDGFYIEDSSNVLVADAFITSTGAKGIYLRTSANITIKNIKIDLANDDAIQIYNVTDLVLTNITIGSAKYHGIKIVSGTNLVFENIVVNGIIKGGDGIVFGDGGNVSNVLLNNIRIYKAEWKALWLYNTVNATLENIVIDGNKAWFKHPGIGIEGQSSGNRNTHNVTITNCIVKEIAGSGEGWESGIFIKYASNVEIYNCEVAFNYRYGIEVYVSDNIILVNNTVYNNTGTGIIVFGSNNILIENNTLSGARDGYGIGIYWNEDNKLYSNNIIIKFNKIIHNSRSGIKIQEGSKGGVAGGQSNIIITNNTIAYNGYGNSTLSQSYAIIVGSSATNIIIRWNDFIDNHHKHSQALINSSILLDYNYWSDYTGKDDNSDGIGDTPYITDGIGVTDNHPRLFKLGETYKPTETTTTPTTTPTTQSPTTTTPTATKPATSTPIPTDYTTYIIAGVLVIIVLVIMVVILRRKIPRK